MELNELSAISPIDGRYRNGLKELASYFSEFALIKYRVKVEIEYFILLCEKKIPQLSSIEASNFEKLRNVYHHFSLEDAQIIKETEKITNHDVKAVEYFIKSKFDELNLSEFKEFVHFGLTSQDINNTAVPLSLKDASIEVLFPKIEAIITKLTFLANQWKSIPMLAKTHGQPASPTRLGKEIYVFVERLEKQFAQLKNIPFSAKFGGATGNFNAHVLTFPNYNWKDFGNEFVNSILNLDRSQFTTQIEHYDNLASYFDALKRINTILIDLDRDIWQYISMGYFTQKVKKGEIGSSAMPHKVNPIDFENSEGNLGISNAIFEHLSAKLPISRLQRDLTDSTVLRNIGVPLAHSMLAYNSLLKGLDKIELNAFSLEKDLENNWAVVAEGIQNILRRERYPNPYEALKELTRTGKPINKEVIQEFIDNLNVANEIKTELKGISPSNYLGLNF